MNLFESVMNTFGFELKKTQPKGALESIEINKEDGAAEIMSAGGVMGFSTNIYQLPTNEIEQLRTYRALAKTSDVDRVLNEIRNEIYIFDVPDKKAIDINIRNSEKYKISASMVKKIKDEFDNVYNIMNFQKYGLEYFDSFYVDGRIFLQKIVDSSNLKKGIQKIINIDSMKMRRLVEYPPPSKEGVFDLNKINPYYIFSDTNNLFESTLNMARVMKLTNDTVAYADSGIYDEKTGAPLSHLWKSIVPYNNMRMMEEALLIYRVVRSPERRVFYINVGNLSKPKAEQYIKDLMNRFKNKLIYDSTTGSIVDRKHIMSMVEDYWLPRRDDGKGTEIQTLPGASSLGTIEDVDLFRKKFAESTNIPPSRLRDDTSSMIFGRTADISRDEYRFRKYLDRVRNRFVVIFEDLLKTQLLLKNIIVDTDWKDIKNCIEWIYAEDNNFVEWKESEVLNNRLETLSRADQFVGRYFTREWVLKNVMKMDDDTIKSILDDVAKQADTENEQSEPTPFEGGRLSDESDQDDSQEQESSVEKESSVEQKTIRKEISNGTTNDV